MGARQIVEIDTPATPIFTIARLPDLTPMPAQLPRAIDVQPDDDHETPH